MRVERVAQRCSENSASRILWSGWFLFRPQRVRRLRFDLAPASHQLDVGGFRVNNQIDVRLAGELCDARLCSLVDLSNDPLQHVDPTPPE
jgi:hypothetical protein